MKENRDQKLSVVANLGNVFREHFKYMRAQRQKDFNNQVKERLSMQTMAVVSWLSGLRCWIKDASKVKGMSDKDI